MQIPVPLALALFTLGGVVPVSALPDAASCPQWHGDAPRLARLERRLVEIVNQQRLWSGRRTLWSDAQLDAVARALALASAARGRQGHASDDGGGPEDRLRAAGVHDWNHVGENLAGSSTVKYRASDVAGRYRSVGCHDVESLTRDLGGGWARSPGHRENLLDRDYSLVGSGVAYDSDSERVYAVHLFVGRAVCGFRGRPCCGVAEWPDLRGCQAGLVCRAELCRP